MKHLHLDPFSGIAGDMMLGALIDLGASLDDIRAKLEALPIDEPWSISAESTLRQGIAGIDVKVHAHASSHEHEHGHEHHHGPHRHVPQILDMIDPLDLSERGKNRIRSVVMALARAEAAVHDIAVEKVHFHEVGAIDSIVDMFGACVGLELLGVDTLSCGPLPVTRGYVQCGHGTMPVPAPATMRLMQDVPVVGLDRQGELVTPTGAALAVGLCESFGPPPKMTLEKVGYGAGDHDFAEAPNLLRACLGRRKS